MITFIDEKGTEHSALVAYSVTNAVNGELSVKGTIYTNDKVLHGIDRGWRFRLDDEYYRVTYAKPNDTGRQIEVEFDAVHQFFYDMSKSMVYDTLDGSKPFETYLQAIFSGSGYTYSLETTVGSIRKENFGNKSRLSLFNDIIKAAGLEFSVRGHVVRILKRIGTDLSAIVRKDLNMNELKIEKNINSFVTYQRGLGAWKDDEDHSKGRYESEYESPLAKIYGRIEAEPVVDERYKETGKLLERLKENVDKSYKVSVEIDMEDLSRAGYRLSRPNPGDFIMAINETLGFRQKVRIVSFTSEYDVGGNLISRKVVCNDIGTVQRATSEISHLSRTLTDSIEGSERALKTATKALVSADGKNTNYFEDVKPLDVPKGILRKGDRLFLTTGDETELYFWSGSEWVLEPTRFDKDKFNTEFDKKAEAINKNIQQVENKAVSALAKAGSNNLLAQEAKRIGLDSIAKLEAFKSQATSAQTALSGDLDALKRTVTSEVNQASEYRRTTTEALSRMTGQMNGFATKSEVKQGIDGLTQTFAKMKVGGRNYIRHYDFDGLLPLSGSFPTWNYERLADPAAKSGYMLKATCTKAGNGGFYKTLFDLRSDEFQGKDMTWSWDMKSSRPIIFYDMGFEAGGLKKNVPVSTEWTRISNTFKVAFKQFYSCVFYANGWEVGDVVYIRDPQLEEGTVATTPRPAPEDGKDEILAARTEFKQTADGLSTKMAAVETYVGQDGQRQEVLRKYTREESARQANAVRELVTRDYVGKATHQETVRAIENKFEAITNPQNGTIATQIANYKNSVDGRFADITSMISGKANQTDFQRVQETSKLYERIIGSNENDISNKVARMALTNQLFQVEVSKYTSQGGPNLIKNSGNPQDSKNWGYWEIGQNPAIRVGAHDFFFKNKRNLFYVNNKTRDIVPSSTIRFPLKRNTSYTVSLTAFNTWNIKGATIYFLGRKSGENQTFTRVVTLADNVKFSSDEAVRKTYTFNSEECDEGFIRIDNNGTTDSDVAILLFGDVDVYEGTSTRPWQPSPEDTNEAVRSVQSQLAGSWAVQNINSAGDLISGLNLGANGHNRLSGKLTHITGETLIDNAVIKSAMIESVIADKITTGTLNAANVNIINLNANKIVGLDATFLRGKIENAIIDWLVGKTLISQNGSTTLNLQTGVFTLNNEDSSITFSRSSDNTATSFSKNGIHFFENRKIIASIGQSAFSSIYDNKHKPGFSINLPNNQGISFSGYDSSSFFEINPHEESLSIQSGFSLLIGIKTSQSVSLEHVFGTQNDVNFSGFRAKGTRRQELRFYADGRIEITRG